MITWLRVLILCWCTIGLASLCVGTLLQFATTEERWSWIKSAWVIAIMLGPFETLVELLSYDRKLRKLSEYFKEEKNERKE